MEGKGKEQEAKGRRGLGKGEDTPLTQIPRSAPTAPRLYNTPSVNQSINESNYFIVRPKVDQRADQLSLSHLGITKTEKNRTKT